MEATVSIEWNDHTDYGELMTTWDWVRACVAGAFIDYDGFGHLATEDKESNIIVRPSCIRKYEPLCDMSGRIVEIPDGTEFTHVMWYNR